MTQRILGACALLFAALASSAQDRRPTTAPLSDYEGVYDYHGSTTITIVAADPLLFAVLDEAKYPLKPLGGDRFLNGPGETIPFQRGADGAVTAFVEGGVRFARRTPVVDATMTAVVRARPRPPRPDGGSAPYLYAPPAQLADGLRVGSAADVGIDAAGISRLVSRVIDGTYADVHSILVYRQGRLVVEEYFYAYDRDRLHQMRSASKSVVSALVGIAIDRGVLAGDAELVTKRLPYARYEHPDARKDNLTLRDLLTMRSGLACDDWDGGSPGNEVKMYPSDDWVKFVLDLPLLDTPGTKGRYCSGNVAVAGRIVERAAGVALPAFAQEHLFTPLGISSDQVRWNYTLSASNASTVAQLYLRPRDMLKLGILFQSEGSWNGRRVVSREWVARSTSRWSTLGDQEYGYFWWHQVVNVPSPGGVRRVDMVVATGNGGQKIYIVPSLDLIVVLTGGNYNSQSPAMAIMANDVVPAIR
jgi:CubicO group peptidase (beta-lactamase class C family)